jgi:hypothetical protein
MQVTFGGYNGRFTHELNAFRVAPHALGSDGAGAVLAEAEAELGLQVHFFYKRTLPPAPSSGWFGFIANSRVG